MIWEFKSHLKCPSGDSRKLYVWFGFKDRKYL